jgi:uncharacterized protein (UPF0548 family)
MFLFSTPSDAVVSRFLDAQEGSTLSYSPVGITTSPVSGYSDDRVSAVIGQGRPAFDAARAAIYQWKMFPSWTRVFSREPVRVGLSVGVLIRHLGFYSLNGARVLYELEEENRAGFAYGTLLDHSERGEELFSVRIDPTSADVYYELIAISRPAHWTAWLGYPVVRALQARFRNDSVAAMRAILMLP